MTGVNRGRLMRGGLSALVRPEARGFTVDLPGGVEIVDLGTAFDVNVSDGHSIDVLVTRGAVRVQSPRLDPRILTAGQHVALRDGALLPPTMLVSATTSRRAKYPIVRGGFVDGAKAYIDRDYTWQGVNAPTCPPILRGADFVQTSNEDKSDAHLSVKLTLDGPATVWVLWNPRAPLPQWLTEAFEQTPWTVTLSIEQGQFVSEDRDLAYSVWRRRVDAAGVVTLGPRAIENDPTIAGMYGLVVTPPDASPSQSPDQSSPPTQPAQRSK
ncbi:MAG: hypothetical protein GC162_20385 [Planctomycetes bacterium]|nr:hypothetical protein [Planctomycetota bacterium]